MDELNNHASLCTLNRLFQILFLLRKKKKKKKKKVEIFIHLVANMYIFPINNVLVKGGGGEKRLCFRVFAAFKSGSE